MIINQFRWIEWNIQHILRHNVETYEVEYVAFDDNPWFRKNKDDSYIMYGVAEGRYIFVVFTIENAESFVITARDMTETEKKLYKKRGKK